jgi:hypothetical protein
MQANGDSRTLPMNRHFDSLRNNKSRLGCGEETSKCKGQSRKEDATIAAWKFVKARVDYIHYKALSYPLGIRGSFFVGKAAGA